MSLVSLLVLILIAGLVFYIITVLPLPQPFKNIALVICGVIVIIWLVTSFLGHSVFLR